MTYSNELWWQFALHGEASRFLRASVGAAAALLLFGFARLMAPLEPFERPPVVAVAISGGRDSLALGVLARAWASARGGWIVGLFESLWSAYLPIESRDIALYLALAIFLVFRPGGIFGTRDTTPRQV